MMRERKQIFCVMSTLPAFYLHLSHSEWRRLPVVAVTFSVLVLLMNALWSLAR